MFQNLRQDLLEKIGEWLDSDTVMLEEVLNDCNPNGAEDDELHAKMADAAMKVYSEVMGLTFLS